MSYFGVAARAGFLSGSTGLESVPGPELPKVEFLDRFNGLILTHVSQICYLHSVLSQRVQNKLVYHIMFLNCYAEENRKFYEENDARFKSSPLLQGLLEKSKLNKEK